MRIKLFVAACYYLGTVVTTPAQVGGIKVYVPFEFHVAKQTFSAGEYILWSERRVSTSLRPVFMEFSE